MTVTVALDFLGNDNGEVAQLSKKLLGPWAEIIAKLFSFVILLGANIVYWILMSNFLYYSVGYVHGKSENGRSRAHSLRNTVIEFVHFLLFDMSSRFALCGRTHRDV